MSLTNNQDAGKSHVHLALAHYGEYLTEIVGVDREDVMREDGSWKFIELAAMFTADLKCRFDYDGMSEKVAGYLP